MKITKGQLRRIIKEEKAKVLAEQKVRRIVRRRLIEQATYDQASDLLSKLSRNPNDSASLDKLEDMVRGLGSSNERDEALDAIANIEYADSPAEKESAVDYATDYVRDAFDAAKDAGGGDKELLKKGVRILADPSGSGVQKALGNFIFGNKRVLSFRLQPYSVQEVSEMTGVPIPSSGDDATDGILFLQGLINKGIQSAYGPSSLPDQITELQYGRSCVNCNGKYMRERGISSAYEFWKDNLEGAPFKWRDLVGEEGVSGHDAWALLEENPWL